MIMNEMEEIAQGKAFPEAFKVICSRYQTDNLQTHPFVNREIRENFASILTTVKESERVIPIRLKIRPLVVDDIPDPDNKEYDWGRASVKTLLKAMRDIYQGIDPPIHPDFMLRVVEMCRFAKCDDIGIANAMGVDVDLIKNSGIEEIQLTKDQVCNFIKTIFPIVQTAYLSETWATKTKSSNTASKSKG